MTYARPHNCFRAGSRPHALDLSILTLPCFQQLAQEQVRPSNTTAAAFLRRVLTGDPNLLLAAAAPLFTLTFGVRNLEWLSLCLQPPSWREEENNREQAAKSLHAGARLHLLDSDLCWSQLCLFSVWLTCCPNLTCSKS